jgi:hypothetical protein
MNDNHMRPHAAHPSRSIANNIIANPVAERPASLLSVETEQMRALLEQLDDVIFSAIQGDAEALAQAQQLWPQVVVELGWDRVEESREQYLRYAIDVTQCMDTSETRSPECAIAALDVISLLTKD